MDATQVPQVLTTIRSLVDGIRLHGGLNSPEAHRDAAQLVLEAHKLLPAATSLAEATEAVAAYHGALLSGIELRRAAAAARKKVA